VAINGLNGARPEWSPVTAVPSSNRVLRRSQNPGPLAILHWFEMKVTSTELIKSGFQESDWQTGALPEIAFMGRSKT